MQMDMLLLLCGEVASMLYSRWEFILQSGQLKLSKRWSNTTQYKTVQMILKVLFKQKAVNIFSEKSNYKSKCLLSITPV